MSLPSVEPFAVLRGGPQLASQVLGALVERALGESLGGEVPQWILVGLAKVLDHRGGHCPAKLLAGWTRERIASELARLREPMRDRNHLAFAGLVVRYGLETQGWTDLQALATFAPAAEGLARWMAETDLESFEAVHTTFRPILAR